MIYTAEGTPARPELEQALKQLDDSLGIRWIFGAWAVTYRWPDADTRRQMIRNGSMDPEAAFDVLCYLPKDCPPEQAAGYLDQHCLHWARDLGRNDIGRLLDHIHAHNAAVSKEANRSTLEYAEELMDANAHVLKEEMLGIKAVKPVYMSESLANQHPEKSKRRKGKDL